MWSDWKDWSCNVKQTRCKPTNTKVSTNSKPNAKRFYADERKVEYLKSWSETRSWFQIVKVHDAIFNANIFLPKKNELIQFDVRTKRINPFNFDGEKLSVNNRFTACRYTLSAHCIFYTQINKQYFPETKYTKSKWKIIKLQTQKLEK